MQRCQHIIICPPCCWGGRLPIAHRSNGLPLKLNVCQFEEKTSSGKAFKFSARDHWHCMHQASSQRNQATDTEKFYLQGCRTTHALEDKSPENDSHIVADVFEAWVVRNPLPCFYGTAPGSQECWRPKETSLHAEYGGSFIL